MYSRELDDQVLTLAASGWTYEFTFVLYDHQSESMWYHLEGTTGLTAIAGPHAGRTLAEPVSVKTRWSGWLADHPGTRFWNYP